MNINIMEKQKTFKELKNGAFFKMYENEVNEEDLYMKILVIDKDGNDSYMALSLKNAKTYRMVDDDLFVTEFKNASFTITLEY